MSKIFTIAEGLESLGALRTGGQGSVYKGRRTGAIYSAVKLIPTPIDSEDENDKNYRNFLNEVAKLQKVNEIPNPNIVKILSSGITESGSFPFIEMEYIDGPDLGELLQPPHEKIFMLKELLKVADQLACALAHCHKVGVKHGDIKSNNVKYNIHSGNYVLLDFGLAIMSEEQRRSSIRHAGAIEFMAPEQHEGKMLLETDVYSYGVILYELLTGQVPFPLPANGDTGRNTVMVAHMEAQVPDALSLRRANLPISWTEEKKAQEMQVPAWLLNLIYKCLQKNPQDRYPSGMELHEAIVNGSLSAIHEHEVAAPIGAAAIQAKNEQEAELAALKAVASKAGIRYNEHTRSYEQDTSMMRVSKTAFRGIIGIAAVCILFFVYSTMRANSAAKAAAADTSSVSASGALHQPSYMYIRPYNYDSIQNAKRLAAERAALKPKVTIAKKPAMPVNDKPKKKKRKKFLGIF